MPQDPQQPGRPQPILAAIIGRLPIRGIGQRCCFAYGALLLSGAACLLVPANPAAAQGACTGAPGERMVGRSRSGVPLCVSDGPAQPAGPPVHAVSSHYVAAWHPDASDVWTAASFRSFEAASRAALDACTRAMGSGCTLTPGAANGAIAIGRDGVGTLWAATGASERKAERAVRTLCAKQQAVCEIISTTTSPSWTEQAGRPADPSTVFSPKGYYRRLFASVAWVDTTSVVGDWGSKVWIDSGYPSAKEAETAAVTRCERDSGATCKVVRTVSDVALTIAVDGNNSIRVGSGPRSMKPRKLAEERCEDADTECTVTAIFDAARRGDFIHDPYQALAKTKE